MKLYDTLYHSVLERAKTTTVELIHIGISYTAVCTSDGGSGIAFTFLSEHESCTVVKDPMDYEGKSAQGLLDLLFSTEIVERSAALALVNALNFFKAKEMPGDTGTLFRDLHIQRGSNIAMVGYFGPVLRDLKAMDVTVDILDSSRHLGEKDTFYKNLRKGEAEALILTSTSIINKTTEEILQNLPAGTPCVMLGPTTPMIPESFSHLPVTILAGTVPVDIDGVLAAIRHGKGTPVIQKSCRKVYTTVQPPQQQEAAAAGLDYYSAENIRDGSDRGR